LSGTGIAGAFSLSAKSFTFGLQAVATPSATQTLTVTNSGTTNLVIGTTTIIGANPGDFSLSANTCAARTIGAGGACTVRIRFTPAAAGARSATLRIPSNRPGSPHLVSLSGTSFSPATIALSVAALRFTGAQSRVGVVSTRTLTIRNNGPGTFVINPLIAVGPASSPNITGPNANQYYVDSTTCNAPVALRATCTIVVAFAPTSVGVKTANLVFRSNTLAGTTTVPISSAAVR